MFEKICSIEAVVVSKLLLRFHFLLSNEAFQLTQYLHLARIYFNEIILMSFVEFVCVF